jgi:ubiquinone/menaquinone biosynthesis C-methylase UbiE
MAQHGQLNSDIQGHSHCTIATQLLRTAQSDAAFLLPHIKKTDHVLDVGCGPGTITTDFAKNASEGKTIGVDISANVIRKARSLAAESKAPTHGPGSVVFEEDNVLQTLDHPDVSFDKVFWSEVSIHLLT